MALRAVKIQRAVVLCRTRTPQIIFATGISVKAGETNVTRLPGSVTFIRCEWREKSTLFTKEAYKRHHVHPALLSEMLGDAPGLWAWVVDPKLSIAFTSCQRMAAETLLLSPYPTKSQVWVSQCQGGDNMEHATDIIVRELYTQSQLVHCEPPAYLKRRRLETGATHDHTIAAGSGQLQSQPPR